MRGIEAAFKVLSENLNDGPFASEALRKLADREKMKAPDISLASSLVYIVMRKREFWEKIADEFLSSRDKLPQHVYTSIIMGTGGLLELRRFSGGVLINGILECLKRNKSFVKYTGMVNAVLRKILETGSAKAESFKRSPSIRERAMYAGVPSWSLPAWLKTWDRAELNEIFESFNQPCYASLRVSPGKLEELSKLLDDAEIHTYRSEISGALRLNQSILPVRVPGFSEGLCTVQGESSILAASLVKKFYSGNGLILDMCSGRGVKAGQILQECDSSKLECWEISEGRSRSACEDLKRLNVYNRAILKQGDSLNLEPLEKPSFVILDAPCSGSGTWNRKPESKWRLDWQKFDAMTFIQKKLLARALDLCESGGHVLYITCSMLKQENENVIAEVISSNNNFMEVSNFIDWSGKTFRRGKPYGMYIWPCDSWLDGFYCSLIMKK